jgi:hypothetical protein
LGHLRPKTWKRTAPVAWQSLHSTVTSRVAISSGIGVRAICTSSCCLRRRHPLSLQIAPIVIADRDPWPWHYKRAAGLLFITI